MARHWRPARTKHPRRHAERISRGRNVIGRHYWDGLRVRNRGRWMSSRRAWRRRARPAPWEARQVGAARVRPGVEVEPRGQPVPLLEELALPSLVAEVLRGQMVALRRPIAHARGRGRAVRGAPCLARTYGDRLGPVYVSAVGRRAPAAASAPLAAVAPGPACAQPAPCARRMRSCPVDTDIASVDPVEFQLQLVHFRSQLVRLAACRGQVQVRRLQVPLQLEDRVERLPHQNRPVGIESVLELI